jgi:hypothetical protein
MNTNIIMTLLALSLTIMCINDNYKFIRLLL